MQKPSRCLLSVLCTIVVSMFAFTFALIPLYNVFCQITGLNGKVDIQHPEQFTRYKDKTLQEITRRIVVEFDTNRNRELLLEFSPEHPALEVKPGELTHTSYHVKNLTSKKIIVQAIPSITPGIIAKHLKKLECFCFNQQTLQPGESMSLPLRFWLEPEIPEDIHRLTLSYTLFDVTGLVKENET